MTKTWARILGLTFCAIPAIACTFLNPNPNIDQIASMKSEANPTDGLEFDKVHGYLPSLLKKLKIDPSSQCLVFSKTSVQSTFISPQTPRALYFNDEVYVGWVKNAPLLEVMAIDPVKGAVMYTIKNDEPSADPFKLEKKDCGRCHGVSRPTSAPRLFARSSQTSPAGYPRPKQQPFDMEPSLPLEKRWGGWYVTGTHGKIRHMGNELSVGTDEDNKIDVEKGANVTSLKKYFDVKPYIAEGSDIVALMVFEHQMQVQNILTETGLKVTDYLSEHEKSKWSELDADEKAHVEADVLPLVEALLCKDEVKLTSQIKGTSQFSANYSKSGIRTKKGKSLKDLDLKTRLFKYPCSPMIYSRSFDALNPVAKKVCYRLLGEVLDGKRQAGLEVSAQVRSEIRQILAETKPEFGPKLR